LGITIDYGEKGKVKFTMYDYLEDILAEMPADMKGTAPTPASDNLFNVDEVSCHALTSIIEYRLYI
jgi:hypothetical protein